MSYEVYKVLHILGAFLLFAAFGGMLLARVRSAELPKDTAHKLAGATHGLALLLLLVAGFGLLARNNLGFEAWVWVKLGIWLVFGAALVLVRRVPRLALILWWLLPLLGVLAAWLGLVKPGS